MTLGSRRANRFRRGVIAVAVVVAALFLAVTSGSAYVGDAFLRFPGVTGDRASGPHRHIVDGVHGHGQGFGERIDAAVRCAAAVLPAVRHATGP